LRLHRGSCGICRATALSHALLLLATLMACSGAPTTHVRNDPHSDCVPSFRELVSPGYMIIGDEKVQDYAVAIIGCRDVLDTLSEQDVDLAHKAIAGYIDEMGIALLGLLHAESRGAYRTELTARVNAEVGREVATDVLLYRVNIKDYF